MPTASAMPVFYLFALLAAAPEATPPKSAFEAELVRLSEEAYQRAWDVSVLGDFQGLGSGAVSWFSPPAGSLSAKTQLLGLQAELGTWFRHFGVSLLGIQVSQGVGRTAFVPEDGTPDGSLALTRYGIWLLQPRARYQWWRFQAMLQLGLGFQILAGEPGDGTGLKRSYSVGGSVRLSVRGFLYQGFFAEVALTARAAGVALNQVPVQAGVLGGLGFAFEEF